MKHAQQGMALIEALVASAVLGIGLLGATQLTLRAMQTATDTRQRGVAQQLAQEAMDCAISGTACPSQDTVQLQGVRYTRQTRITSRGHAVQDVQVIVQWASPQAVAGSTEPASLVWHSSVSSVPRWVGP
jgi:prepilin-type N-terminal cleavage/methylation domain-containing protein